MKPFKFSVVIILYVLLTSCDEDNEVINAPVTWEKIEFENESSVYGIYGDIEDYLLIATTFKILRTEDGGKTWETVQQVLDPVAQFYPVNEAIYAVSNGKDYVSHDLGKTWEDETFDWQINSPWQSLESADGILYQIVNHSSGELALPTSVLRSRDQGNSWEAIFPHEHIIYSWHMDTHNKVYLGTFGMIWDGQFFRDNPKNSAFLFYMK